MFRAMKYAYEISKEKSFSKAAKKLFISQPSLSITIKKLERNLGVTLFDRSSMPIQLTEAGQVYMEMAGQIIAIQDNMESYVKDYTELKTGTLALGAPHTFSSLFMPVFIRAFSKKYPGVKITLDEADTMTLQKKLLNNDVDIVIDTCDFDGKFFLSYPIIEERILLMVPKDNKINNKLLKYRFSIYDLQNDYEIVKGKDPVPLSYFKEELFIMLHKGHDVHKRGMDVCAQYGFYPNVYMYLNQLMSCYYMSNEGIGITFISDTIVKMIHVKSDNVFLYKLNNKTSQRNILMAHKKSRHMSKAAREFMRVAVNESVL